MFLLNMLLQVHILVVFLCYATVKKQNMGKPVSMSLCVDILNISLNS